VLGAGEEADRAIAERLGISVEAARRMVQRLDARDISLEVETSGESRLKLLDTLQSNDNQEHDVLKKEVEASVNDAISRAIAELDVRERYITERRLMADPSEELSLAEIGRELGVSRERARQLESRTKSKLKSRIPALGGAVVGEWLREYEPPARLAAAR
jgi:RNA polymerase sigma-32 factor